MQARIKDTTQLFCPAAVSRGIRVSIKSCWLQLKAQSSHEVARELVHHDSHMASYKFLRAGATLRTIYLSLSRCSIGFLCLRRFLCAHVNVLPIDTQKGNNRPRLLRDTHQNLLHYSFPSLFLNKLLALGE